MATTLSRGRVLSRQQVRFSDAPVRLAAAPENSVPAPLQRIEPDAESCGASPAVELIRDPVSGDLTAIQLRCRCGEVTVLQMDYDSVNVDADECLST